MRSLRLPTACCAAATGLVLTTFAAENPGGYGPAAAREQVKALKAADGLEITLFASEPMVRNPANMDVDARGRVWVTEGANYRVWQKWGRLRPEGDRIVISLSSTNRDERRCPQAATFDLDRSPAVRHLAFGRGAHYCPGAALARLVASQAVRDLVASVDSIELAPDFVYAAQQSLLAWGPRRLDVIVVPAAEPSGGEPCGGEPPDSRSVVRTA